MKAQEDCLCKIVSLRDRCVMKQQGGEGLTYTGHRIVKQGQSTRWISLMINIADGLSNIVQTLFPGGHGRLCFR